jgi:hypothetical protein
VKREEQEGGRACGAEAAAAEALHKLQAQGTKAGCERSQVEDKQHEKARTGRPKRLQASAEKAALEQRLQA